MIAYCGLECLECKAFIATQADDDRLRADCAQAWTYEFKYNVRPEQINCDGCKADGRKFFVCKMCAVRKCAQERKVENCTLCTDYACEKEKALLDMASVIRSCVEIFIEKQKQNQ